MQSTQTASLDYPKVTLFPLVLVVVLFVFVFCWTIIFNFWNTPMTKPNKETAEKEFYCVSLLCCLFFGPQVTNFFSLLYMCNHSNTYTFYRSMASWSEIVPIVSGGGIIAVWIPFILNNIEEWK